MTGYTSWIGVILIVVAWIIFSSWLYERDIKKKS